MVYDGYVKYEEAEMHRSAVMQDFRDSEKKNNNKKWPTGSHFGLFSVKFVMGYLYMRHYFFVLYSRFSHFAFLELGKYYKIQNGRLTAIFTLFDPKS